ncbi:MAG: GvpL/GvpF family gas vesicle protein [Acidobacteria bacterium]|nr:GvpL/GvpF family gas vesicle protein [Acidobacteriota bacterium]MBV9475180.1 GvpL/GvpF family gas vesicle protein [Acidobacteriota bacterium]
MDTVLYVYAVTREPATPDTDGIDGTRRFGVAESDGIAAVFTAMPSAELSQEVIDRRANDLEWLGAIGYRHQAVVAELMKLTAIVPLRAFTLFSGADALRAYLHEHAHLLGAQLERLGDKQEWTLRVEFEPARWSEALVARAESLRELQAQIAAAPPGRAFLLRKKLDDEKKRASREAEQNVVAEIEQAVAGSLRCETFAETRERRDGAFPQINILLERDEEAALQELHATLMDRYAGEGVVVGVSGPWPPYSFAHD